MICNDKKTVGLIIKQKRIKCRFSQNQLAEKVDLSEKHISNIERGLNFPALDTFFKLCKVLNLSLDDFGLEINSHNIELKQEIITRILTANDKTLSAYSTMLNSTDKNLKL